LVTLPYPVSTSQSVGSEVALITCRALSSISEKVSRPTSGKPPTAVEEPEPLT
jgi:hypothetical protein